MAVRGWTPSLTPDVDPEDFTDAVERAGMEYAVALLGVSQSTVERWMIGLGMPNPGNQEKIGVCVSHVATTDASSRSRHAAR